jgi:hypothetical protein
MDRELLLTEVLQNTYFDHQFGPLGSSKREVSPIDLFFLVCSICGYEGMLEMVHLLKLFALLFLHHLTVP